MSQYARGCRPALALRVSAFGPTRSGNVIASWLSGKFQRVALYDPALWRLG